MNTDNTGAEALKSIVDQVDKLNAEYLNILAEVPTHQEQLTMARTALGNFHTRLAAMRETVDALRNEVLLLPYDSVPTNTRSAASNIIHTLSSMLRELFWRLWEFREGP